MICAVILLLSMAKSANGSENSPICHTPYYKQAEAMTDNEDLRLAIAWRLKADDCSVLTKSLSTENKELKKQVKAAENKQKISKSFLIFAGVLAGSLAISLAIIGGIYVR